MYEDIKEINYPESGRKLNGWSTILRYLHQLRQLMEIEGFYEICGKLLY